MYYQPTIEMQICDRAIRISGILPDSTAFVRLIIMSTYSELAFDQNHQIMLALSVGRNRSN